MQSAINAKSVLRIVSEEQFCNLNSDPWEAVDLLDTGLSSAQQAAYDELKDQVTELRAGG